MRKETMLQPKISIIIPCYNVENYISRCLDSCVEQTLFDIEIVCVDDGSKDRTAQILDYYAKKDCRIKVIHKENAGVSAARNTGLEHATGKWIMFADSDDYLDSLACEKVWKESMTNTADIIVHGGYIVPDYPKPESWKFWAVLTRTTVYKDFSFRLLDERGATPFLWLQAYRRELLERTGVRFCEDITFGEDLIFQFENLPFANGVSFISERLYYYRWYREGSLMKEATADLDARTSRHISNIGVIASFWKEHGLLDRFGKEFLAWAVGFVIPDLERLELKDVPSLAKQLDSVLEENDLKRFSSGLHGAAARHYRSMLKLKG